MSAESKTPSAEVSSPKNPAIKKGWLMKQGRSGMIKNWKKRYFVISQGMLNYYQHKSDEFPFGEDLKGDLYLGNTEIIEENKTYNEKQIYIVNFNGDKNILIEAESADEAQEWMESIREHMIYANRVARESIAITDKRASQQLSSSQDKRSSARYTPQSSTALPAVPSPVAVTTSDDQKRYSTILGPYPAVPSSKPRTDTVTSVDSDEASQNGASRSNPVSSSEHRTNNTAPASSTHAVPSDGDSEEFIGGFLDYMEESLKIFTEKDVRRDFSTNFFGNARLVATGLSKNIKEGEAGKRGEKLIFASLVIIALIVLGINPVLYVIVKWLLKIAALLTFLIGGLLSTNALWELKGNFNLFAAPSRDNLLTTRGAYSLVRHPFYGGIVISCASAAVLQDSVVKLALSAGLLVLLSSLVSFEELLLLQLHKKKYSAYASDKKKLIPFIH